MSMFNPLVGGAPVSAGQGTGLSSAPDLDRNRVIIETDGTPVRVAMLAIGAAVGLAALRWSGFRFNVGVSR